MATILSGGNPYVQPSAASASYLPPSATTTSGILYSGATVPIAASSYPSFPAAAAIRGNVNPFAPHYTPTTAGGSIMTHAVQQQQSGMSLAPTMAYPTMQTVPFTGVTSLPAGGTTSTQSGAVTSPSHYIAVTPQVAQYPVTAGGGITPHPQQQRQQHDNGATSTHEKSATESSYHSKDYADDSNTKPKSHTKANKAQKPTPLTYGGYQYYPYYFVPSTAPPASASHTASDSTPSKTRRYPGAATGAKQRAVTRGRDGGAGRGALRQYSASPRHSGEPRGTRGGWRHKASSLSSSPSPRRLGHHNSSSTVSVSHGSSHSRSASTSSTTSSSGGRAAKAVRRHHHHQKGDKRDKRRRHGRKAPPKVANIANRPVEGHSRLAPRDVSPRIGASRAAAAAAEEEFMLFKPRRRGCCFGCNACFCGACDHPGGCCGCLNCRGCCDREYLPPTGCCSRQKTFDSDDYRQALTRRKAKCCCAVE